MSGVYHMICYGHTALLLFTVTPHVVKMFKMLGFSEAEAFVDIGSSVMIFFLLSIQNADSKMI